MKKTFTILVFFLFIHFSYSDTIETNRKLNELERQVKQIDTNQLNYKIEKDLLKETYSNNYEKISLIITLILGVMSVLGYLGLKDITGIKKEYEKELAKLKELQGQFNLKSLEFDNNKNKFEEELKQIIKENEEQSRKIKFIELKDKSRTLSKENQLTPSLEFANAALDINGEDVELLNIKGSVLCRLNQIKEAVNVFNNALKINPEDKTTIYNITECLYFDKDIPKAKKIIEENKSLFEAKENGKLFELFEVLELYFEDKKEELITIVKTNLSTNNLRTKSPKFNNWNLTDAIYFIHYEPESEVRKITQNLLWYWDGQINGEILLKRLNIEIDTTEE
ncbi:tetratricopeptide repeat protein [Flavobacterium psychrophilum]|uniref:tetratricopeptide repeat protein n=1 Tax=Flavobacterium psychrophilum TaxID=96345 RepID=UPI00106CF639|nr:hypothetical protein [Flavobacterium psychrophilum]